MWQCCIMAPQYLLTIHLCQYRGPGLWEQQHPLHSHQMSEPESRFNIEISYTVVIILGCFTTQTLNLFSCYATKIRNALPTSIKLCKSLLYFKSALKEHLQLAAIWNWHLPVKTSTSLHVAFVTFALLFSHKRFAVEEKEEQHRVQTPGGLALVNEV